MLVPVTDDAEPTVFSLFIERPGANLNDSWPGKNVDGTSFVGRIPLAAGAGTCCVVALREPLQPGRLEVARPTDEESQHLRGLAAQGSLIMTIVGETTDGAIALIDLRAESSV